LQFPFSLGFLQNDPFSFTQLHDSFLLSRIITSTLRHLVISPQQGLSACRTTSFALYEPIVRVSNALLLDLQAQYRLTIEAGTNSPILIRIPTI